MSLSREQQMLYEMGLTPIWKLRADRSVLRKAPEEEACETVQVSPSTASSSASPPSFPAPDIQSPPPLVSAVRQATLVAEKPLTPSVEPSTAGCAAGIAELGWDELRQRIAECRACVLCQKRKQAVPGVGDIHADWLFIGEGPGAEEDERGEPFVGQAGKLLDAMLSAIDLQRGQGVYIANAVKCRPPENRTPEAGEMAACLPFLKRQIELIRPKLIVLLGRAAAHAVLGAQGSLASLRGKTLSYQAGDCSIPVVVTYHPAYLLRTLPDKALAWEDLCRARSLLSAALDADVNAPN